MASGKTNYRNEQEVMVCVILLGSDKYFTYNVLERSALRNYRFTIALLNIIQAASSSPFDFSSAARTRLPCSDASSSLPGVYV
jgi:hypothetical protein